MKTKLLIALALMLGSLGTARAQSYFVRAQAVAVFPTKGHYDDTAGIDLSGGISLGAKNENEFSLSLGGVHWEESCDYRDSIRVTVDNNTNTTTIRIGDTTYWITTTDNKISITGDQVQLPDGTIRKTDYRPSLDVAPLLARYRYYIGDPNARVRIFVGGGIGLAHVQARSRVWGRSYHSETDSAWKFAWDGTAGVAIKLNRRLALDFSYAYQEVEGATLNLRNVAYKFEPLKSSMLKGGVTWQF